MKLTPWFNGSKALPVRAGYYLTRPKNAKDLYDYRFWWFDPAAPTDRGTKLFWFHHDNPKEGVKWNCTDASRYEWRGITKPTEVF